MHLKIAMEYNGTRRIKASLSRKGIITSRRRIRRIMIKYGLESVYTHKKYRNHKSKVNEKENPNLINREFNERKELEIIASDLTYVRVGNTYHYISILLDLFNREIRGYACGRHKNAKLVYQAFSKIKGDLRNICVFHSDRGSEFDNLIIDKCLDTFDIKR